MWGDNSVGQIGLGHEGFAAEPREVVVDGAVTWVSCGHQHSALVTGTAQCERRESRVSHILLRMPGWVVFQRTGISTRSAKQRTEDSAFRRSSWPITESLSG